MVWRLRWEGARRFVSGGGVAAGGPGCGGGCPEGCGTGAPEGASGGQVCPMRCRCGGGEAALLRPGRAAHTVTLKARQHARVLCDRQWQ
jgi:hypothetical protein